MVEQLASGCPVAKLDHIIKKRLEAHAKNLREAAVDEAASELANSRIAAFVQGQLENVFHSCYYLAEFCRLLFAGVQPVTRETMHDGLEVIYRLLREEEVERSHATQGQGEGGGREEGR